jgi:hypothetical protein
MKGSIVAAVFSAWWNPYFVQVNRGFTRHLLGLTQWYSFQGLIVFFRIAFRAFAQSQSKNGESQSAQLGAHFLMVGLMSLVSWKPFQEEVSWADHTFKDLLYGKKVHQG